MDKLDIHAMIKRILYEGGQTPEGVYEIALNIVKTENEQEQRKKEIEKKRKAMLSTFKDYLDVVDDAPTSDEFMKMIEKEFIDIERGTGSAKKQEKKKKKYYYKDGTEIEPEIREIRKILGLLDE